MIYTGPTSPSHTLSGAIDTLKFGNGGYSAGSLGATLFTLDGLDAAIGNGFVDGADADTYYDAILDRLSTSPNNLVHDLILDLMGGMGGPGSTSVLQGILDAEGITYTGTSSNEVFDSFAGNDVFNSGGGVDSFQFHSASFGNDTVNGFVVGSGDQLKFDDSIYATAADALADVHYYTGFAAVELDANNKVFLIGVTSANPLTAADFAII
jgi:hypothetical protein